MVTREVNIYVMRHGEKDGDELTDKGREQVWRSVLRHLKPVGPFDLVVRTTKERARQTAQIIVANLGCNFPDDYDGEVDDGFDFTDLDAWMDPPIDWDIQKNQWDQPNSGSPTVKQLFDEIPQSIAFAGQARYAVRQLAMRMVVQKAENRRAVVVSHSPVAEAAAPNPAKALQLAPADIVVYTVEVSDGAAQIVDAAYRSCPIR